MKNLLLILGGTLIVIVTLIVGLFAGARFSDGPMGPIAGGPLITGEFVDAANANWENIVGEKPVIEIELQLESSGTSRTTGAFVYEGQLYVPCDLGYVWHRLPNGTARLALYTMWLLKDWHLNAADDGRVIVRTQGNRYKLEAIRVNDERLLRTFRDHVSTAAASAFDLRDVKTNPENIWFFRLDPREI